MESSNSFIEYELFNDLPRSEFFHSFLYEWFRSVWLDQFMNVIGEKNNCSKNFEEKLILTLDYLYPLLKSWKILVKVTNPDSEKWSEYTEFTVSDADEAVKVIKEMWLWFDDVNKRNSFSEFNVQFKLPDWDYVF